MQILRAMLKKQHNIFKLACILWENGEREKKIILEQYFILDYFIIIFQYVILIKS